MTGKCFYQSCHYSENPKRCTIEPSRCIVKPTQCSARVEHPVCTAHLEKPHFTEPEPIKCKWCGSMDIVKYGIREGVQEYLCKHCGRKFTTKDAPYGMRTPTEQIGMCLTMFYNGLSFSDLARSLAETYQNPVSRSTVYRWITKYTQEAIRQLEPLKPTLSNTWVVDETVVEVLGENWWFWDVLDEGTRFLLASHLSKSRTIRDVETVMNRAHKRAGKAPHFILSDKLAAYIDGIEKVFGSESHHIQSQGMTTETNINIIERFHSTVKERTKILRGFKTMVSAELLMDGFLIHYNFFRPHMALKDKTPAEVAKIKSPYQSWTDLVRKTGNEG